MFARASLHPDDIRVLDQYHFNAEVYERNLKRLRAGASLGVLSDLGPLVEQDLISLPALNSQAAREAIRVGEDALLAGKLAVIVLAGGMATRFGGGVKGLLEISPARTLLELHRRRIASSGPLGLMTSRATHMAISEWASLHEEVFTFTQGLAPRATEEGELWRDAGGRLSFAATGHGDLIESLKRSGSLAQLRKEGVETILMINVDNVAATPSPLIYGLHLLGGAALSVEVTPRGLGDRGGLTLRHRGAPRIVEDFLAPPDLDTSSVGWLNTNTLWIQIAELEREFELSWVAARKELHGQPVIQFERLIGELTAFLPTRFVTVEREGRNGRFLPIKTQDDLPRAQRWLTDFEGAR